MIDLPHLSACLAIEEKTLDPYDRLIEVIADLEKGKSAVDRALHLLYEMREKHPRNRY